jgi:phytanoyl-CoA hydroxylase
MTSNTTDVTQAMPWEANSISVGSIQLPSKTNENAGFTRALYQPVQLLVDDYRKLKQHGFVKVEGLIPQEDIRAISAHMDRVIEGMETGPGFPVINSYMAQAERVARFSRIHNAHRVHALHERFLLHPRILDVIEQLNGPDVLALQSMMFFKQPGQPGQG